MSLKNPCIWQLSQQWRGRPVDVDGDEERRSGGVAVLGDAPRAEAADTDVAPDGGSADVRDGDEVTVGDPDGLPTDESPADESPADQSPADESSADEDGAAPTDEATVDASPEEAGASGATEAVAAGKPVRRKWSLRRSVAIAAVVLAAALAVSAFATSGSPATTGDSYFLDTARSQGHTIAPGQQEGLLVSAAHKICDRRESHSTTAERRATALSTDELHAVNQSFGGDSRAFTVLALDTFCSS
jgi:Protein of unknown function (DUF732)